MIHFFYHFQFYSQSFHILCLIFAFIGLGVSYTTVLSCACSDAGSGAGLAVRVLSRFFVGNILLLKLLRIFSLVLKNSPMLFRKDCFICFIRKV